MIADRPPIIDINPPPPRRRPKRREKRRGTKCLNCYTPTTSRYCPECGQENVPVNIGLWEIFREAVEEFIRFDSKLIRTLIPLIVSPGRLTREWSAGRRTAFLSPLKLYLTVTAIFFLVLPQVAIKGNGGKSEGGIIHISTGSDPRTTAGAKGKKDTNADDSKPWTKEYIDEQVREVPALFRYPVSQLMKLRNLGITKEKGVSQLLQTMVEHFPTALFAMLPMYSAVLWLLYVRNRRYYVEHLVFALHCHAFFFVILTVTVLAKAVGGEIVQVVTDVVAGIWIPAYSFAALKLAYQQGWIKTSVKWFVLGFSYTFLLGFATLASLVMAAVDMPEPPTAAELAAQEAVSTQQKKPIEAPLKAADKKPKSPASPSKASPPKDEE